MPQSEKRLADLLVQWAPEGPQVLAPVSSKSLLVVTMVRPWDWAIVFALEEPGNILEMQGLARTLRSIVVASAAAGAAVGTSVVAFAAAAAAAVASVVVAFAAAVAASETVGEFVVVGSEKAKVVAAAVVVPQAEGHGGP